MIQNTFGLTAPSRTITFREHVLSSDSPVTAEYSPEGVTFSGVRYSEHDARGISEQHIDRNTDFSFVGNFQSGVGASNPFSITFNQIVSEAAFAIGTQSTTTDFSAYLNNVQVGSFTAHTDNTQTNNFFGFRNIAGGFNRIDVSTHASDGAAVFDNLQSLPEPVGTGLLAVGLLGLLVRRRTAADEESAGAGRVPPGGVRAHRSRWRIGAAVPTSNVSRSTRLPS